MKQLKSIGTSVGGFILIVLVYLVVNMLSVDETSTEVLIEATNALELVEKPGAQDDFNELSETIVLDDDYDYVHEVVVDSVIDGDTIVVEMYGELVRVRFSGVNTPESVGDYKDNPENYGKEASAYTKSVLKEGLTIYLEEDVKALDKYDRYLAYIWLKHPKEGEVLTDCFNAMLLEQGYARWFNDFENTRYAELFEELQKEARDQRIGMWQ